MPLSDFNLKIVEKQKGEKCAIIYDRDFSRGR